MADAGALNEGNNRQGKMSFEPDGHKPSGQFVTVSDIRLHYINKGVGQPVVLLHGNAGFLQDYSLTILDQLAQDYQALAFDRPGHGYSERPTSESATINVQARLLHEALTTLGIERPLLVGHSWSGALSLSYALQYPEELAGLVLLAPAVYEGESEIPLLSVLPQLPLLGELAASVGASAIGRRIIERGLAQAFAPETVPPDYLEVALKFWTRPSQVKAYVEDEWIFNLGVTALSARYPTLRSPLVIVTGDADSLVNPNHNAYPLHHAIPHSSLIVLPGAGHQLPHTRPGDVLDAIRAVAERAGSNEK